MIDDEFELDIPSLTDEGIQIQYAFIKVRELTCSSMIDGLIMIKMMTLLVDSFHIIEELQTNNIKNWEQLI